MESARFDRLARSLGSGSSRRQVLAGLLAGLLVPLDAAAKRGKGSGKGKHRKGRGKDRGKEPRRLEPKQESCWPGVRCTPAKGANVSRCDLEDSTAFNGLDCTRCNLSYANLRGVDARGANFTRANLSHACLVNANLSGATIAGNTNLSFAIFCRTTMPNGSINNSGCNQGTSCCQACIAIGQPCGSGGACCGQAVCSGGICACPSGTRNCNGVCQECCSGNDCPRDPCQTWACTGGQCIAQGTDPDLTACDAFSPDEGVCCSGACTEGTCCVDANCTGNSNRCVDLDAAGNTCVCGTTGEACSGNAPTCCGAAPGGVCTDLQTDANNCGVCGRTCSAGASCCGGVCKTPTATCAALDRTCGTAPDGGCGTLHCGVCPAGSFGGTPSCNNGTCDTCANTCPGALCGFCFNLAEGDTVCGRASDVRCSAPCSSSDECPADRPFCIASTTIRSSGETRPISSICTTVQIAAACSEITPC